MASSSVYRAVYQARGASADQERARTKLLEVLRGLACPADAGTIEGSCDDQAGQDEQTRSDQADEFVPVLVEGSQALRSAGQTSGPGPRIVWRNS